MELNEIFKLIDAGYTKADIEALTAQPAPADPEPAQADPEPSPAPAQPDPEPAPAQAQNDHYARLEKLLTTLIGAQQGQNINADIGAAEVSRRTPEQILGSVIAPPRKESKK